MRLFLVGGGRRGDDLNHARIQGAGDASDAATLAGRVVALEGRNHRNAPEAWVAGEDIEATLVGLEFLLVLGAGELLVEIQRFQDVQIVHPRQPGKRGNRVAGAMFAGESQTQGFQHDFSQHQTAVALVAAFDDVPGRLRAAG